MSKDFIKTKFWQFKNFSMPTSDEVEQFRLNLEREQKRAIDYGEAEEVCMELLSFFDVLAGNRRIVRDKDEQKP